MFTYADIASLWMTCIHMYIIMWNITSCGGNISTTPITKIYSVHLWLSLGWWWISQQIVDAVYFTYRLWDGHTRLRYSPSAHNGKMFLYWA